MLTVRLNAPRIRTTRVMKTAALHSADSCSIGYAFPAPFEGERGKTWGLREGEEGDACGLPYHACGQKSAAAPHKYHMQSPHPHNKH